VPITHVLHASTLHSQLLQSLDSLYYLPKLPAFLTIAMHLGFVALMTLSVSLFFSSTLRRRPKDWRLAVTIFSCSCLVSSLLVEAQNGLTVKNLPLMRNLSLVCALFGTLPLSQGWALTTRVGSTLYFMSALHADAMPPQNITYLFIALLSMAAVPGFASASLLCYFVPILPVVFQSLISGAADKMLLTAKFGIFFSVACLHVSRSLTAEVEGLMTSH